MKKLKKNLVDRVNSKGTAKKLNPFEVHINRKKYDVLGKKSKTEKGLPGISRSRAIKKRKATLLQEYNLKGKTNQFVDRRIGERDPSMTHDDKIIARYTTERMRFHSKKSLYNLGDNETLTHRGTSLADIEKFDDPKSEDEEDEDDVRNKSGKLDEDFVSEAHFGGGMLKKVDNENRSRKDLIDQMIADSKKRKAEQQKLREQTLDLTEKLDSEWRDILPLVSSAKNSRNDEAPLKSERRFANYDIISKELIFEARGKATDKLKSEAEIAKEERERLEEMEKLRLARMKGEDTNSGTKHRSADDLDDGFDYNEEFVPKKKRKKNEEDEEPDFPHPSTSAQAEHKIGNDSEEEEDDDDDVEEENEDDGEEEDEDDADEENDEGEQEESDDETDDDLSDLKSSDEEEEEEKPEPVVQSKKKVSKSKIEREGAGKKKPTPLKDVIVKKEIDSALNETLKDLPFTLGVPETYEEFEEMCSGKEAAYQAVVVERMVKSNHPSLPDGSREKLVKLFAFCLQHLQDTATDDQTMHSSFLVLEKLAPWLYDLMHFDPKAATSSFCDVIKEKYDDFLKRPRRFPSIDTLVFLKLAGILYPTSDYRHRVVTPALVFMQHMLSSCRIQSSTDVSVGLFITTLILEYTSLSKRITPEVFNFLAAVLRLAQSTDCKLPNKPPLRSKNDFSLHVPPTLSTEGIKLTPLGTIDLILRTDSAHFKLRVIQMALRLLEEFCGFFNEAADFLIVEPFLPLLEEKLYCDCFKTLINGIRSKIVTLKSRKLYKLAKEKKGPKPLKLYEPKIEDVYTFKKKRPMTKEKEEHDKLLYKYKKEVKGALREIRRDNTFLSKLKFSETKASDQERQRKVKEIFGDAAQQAGEINKLKRKK